MREMVGCAQQGRNCLCKAPLYSGNLGLLLLTSTLQPLKSLITAKYESKFEKANT